MRRRDQYRGEAESDELHTVDPGHPPVCDDGPRRRKGSAERIRVISKRTRPGRRSIWCGSPEVLQLRDELLGGRSLHGEGAQRRLVEVLLGHADGLAPV